MKNTKNQNGNFRNIGGLRIAKVTYDHHDIRVSDDGTESIGTMIDNHIRDTLASGSLINEVSLFFETREQQEALADCYRPDRMTAY